MDRTELVPTGVLTRSEIRKSQTLFAPFENKVHKKIENLIHTCINNYIITERGGSVVTHETRIREVPGSNPGVDQPDWGFFVGFLSQQGTFWVGFSLPRSI